MKDKLLVAGCSYTQYNYPTWADWLGEHFNEYTNLGWSGMGARHSYIKIVDYFKYSDINPEDYVVIVQWSSLLRNDTRKMECNTWVGGGQIDNNPYYSDEYLEKHFNPFDKLNDIVHYVDHLILLSEKLGFKLLMTYMFEPWIQDFLGEPVNSRDIVKKNIKSVIRSKYLITLKQLSKSKYWLDPSIERYSLDNPPRHMVKTTIDGKPYREHHPTPYQHFLYSRFIAKELNIKLQVRKYKKLSMDITRFLSENYNDLKLKKKLEEFDPTHKKLEKIIKEVL